ncbi:MAG: M20 family metallopeptidase [Nitrospinae bacterium]|nr:M20 family metallopeptidase [Nitrospinota bacterium]
MNTDQLKSAVIKEIDRLNPEIVKLSRLIHSKPELAYKEFFASDTLTSFLKNHGFKIERGIGGLPTAFTASAAGRIKAPAVAFIAEYDALPKLGHACGHNMIGAISAGAAAALRNLALDSAGRIIVIGTPAEEGGGGKIKLIEKGVFNGIDIALMAHPSNKTRVIGRMLAVVDITFTFIGKSSHASSFPYEGINALDGVILTYNNINALRQQLKEDVRIHGIITEGGQAPNIIPDRAAARFYVRTLDMKYFKEVLEKVKDCARGAAKAARCRLRIDTGKFAYHPFKPNYTLSGIFRENMKSIGIKEDLIGERDGMGSSDIGNLSQVIPTIHPEFAIGKMNVVNHSPEFARAAVSKFGTDMMIKMTKAAAMTALDVFCYPEKVKEIKREFKN